MRWIAVTVALVGCASGGSADVTGEATGGGPTGGGPTSGGSTGGGSTGPGGSSGSTGAAPTTGDATTTGTTGTTGETGETSETSTGAPGCAPVTNETFVLAQDVPLGCGADAAVDVFDVAPAHRGRAAGRATLTIEHTQNGGGIHFWNATVRIGEHEYGYGIGDDLCSGYEPVVKTNLGVGKLTDASDRARVPMYQGAAPCTPGALKVLAGSELTLWYEDPACEGEHITWTSWYATQGFEATYVWQTMMAEILAMPLELPPGDQALLLSVVEGSPDKNPNDTCGGETQTLVSQLAVDAAVVDQAEMLLPASGGQGHLVLGNAATVFAPGPHALQLLVGANVFDSAVRTGGCCGDAALLAIRLSQ
jgi:hypothetical protein